MTCTQYHDPYAWVTPFLMGMIAALAVAYLIVAHQPRTPPLIGIACVGSGGDIFAFEEDDFPTPCREIEQYAPRG